MRRLLLILSLLVFVFAFNFGIVDAHEPTHVVSYGETLSGIAWHYGVSVYDLAYANHIHDKHHIHAGQVLVIPNNYYGVTIGHYTVQYGDTLGWIAQVHGVSVHDLAYANHIQNPNWIHTGQVLSIPGW